MGSKGGSVEVDDWYALWWIGVVSTENVCAVDRRWDETNGDGVEVDG